MLYAPCRNKSRRRSSLFLALPLWVVCGLSAWPVSAQVADAFADGDFSQRPVWSGDDSRFVVENGKLRLRAPASSQTAYLATPSKAINNAEWRCTVELGFNPSENNHVRIYAAADKANLNEELNGYFVQVGSRDDDVSLYRQQGNTTIRIIDGADGRVDASKVSLALKLTRDEAGVWQLFSDVGITGNFVSEGRARDGLVEASAYFGVRCRYTSTRADRFYFDDFAVTGEPYRDTRPPAIVRIDTLSSAMLDIVFDEPLDKATAVELSNYMISEDIYPVSAKLQPDRVTVRLTLNKALQNGGSYRLKTTGVADVSGNAIASAGFSFVYLRAAVASFKAVIIHEIMPRPRPAIRLPEAEFVELYNRSPNAFDLAGWQLSDERSTAVLPSVIFMPNTYIVIVSMARRDAFDGRLPLVGVSALPSLNDDGDRLVLRNADGQLVDSLYYTSAWFGDTEKAKGGWSLELIDPENPCGERDNWTASEDERGGTPGEINSVSANKPDRTGPKLISVVARRADQVAVAFNERLERPLRNATSFDFTPPLTVGSYRFASAALRTLLLQLETPLQRGQEYTLTVSGLSDCNGNPLLASDNKGAFGLPEKAASGDIIFNEALFNPRAGGVEFVELYNRSNAYIDIANWLIVRADVLQATSSGRMDNDAPPMAPHAYRVLTADPVLLRDRYPQGASEAFSAFPLPSLPDREATLKLVRADGVTIDSLYYNRSFHSPFLQDDEGVSLERLSFDDPTYRSSNWLSASAAAGFATPGRVNSNALSGSSLSVGQVTIEPTFLTSPPQGSGFVEIRFSFKRAGWVATVKIMDHRGRVIKTIAANETLSREGFFRWDGDREGQERARAGYYYVRFEVFADDGRVERFHKRVIVAAP